MADSGNCKRLGTKTIKQKVMTFCFFTLMPSELGLDTLYVGTFVVHISHSLLADCLCNMYNAHYFRYFAGLGNTLPSTPRYLLLSISMEENFKNRFLKKITLLCFWVNRF